MAIGDIARVFAVVDTFQDGGEGYITGAGEDPTTSTIIFPDKLRTLPPTSLASGIRAAILNSWPDVLLGYNGAGEYSGPNCVSQHGRLAPGK